MSNWLIALLFAIGASAWIYPKLNSRSGNTISGQVLVVTALLGCFIFVITWIILRTVLPK